MKTSFTFLLSVLALAFVSSAVAQAPNPITIENAKPGTTGWELTNPAMYREIEGYASQSPSRKFLNQKRGL